MRRYGQNYICATFQFNLTVPCVAKLSPSLYDKTADVRVNTMVSPSVLISFLCILSCVPFFLTSLSPFVPHLISILLDPDTHYSSPVTN
jgi:hypothetical protein